MSPSEQSRCDTCEGSTGQDSNSGHTDIQPARLSESRSVTYSYRSHLTHGDAKLGVTTSGCLSTRTEQCPITTNRTTARGHSLIWWPSSCQHSGNKHRLQADSSLWHFLFIRHFHDMCVCVCVCVITVPRPSSLPRVSSKASFRFIIRNPLFPSSSSQSSSHYSSLTFRHHASYIQDRRTAPPRSTLFIQGVRKRLYLFQKFRCLVGAILKLLCPWEQQGISIKTRSI